jgi:hypothetical protein
VATVDAKPAEELWTSRRVNRTALVTMVVMLFAWSVDYIDRFAISMALPSIGTEFALSKSAQGWLADRFSYPAAFGFLIGTTLLAAAVAFWVPQRADQFTFAS